MKFVISSATLCSHLITAGSVIVKKNNLPILDCFCFDIKDKLLTITASDNDSTVTATLELNECDADIRFAINAKTLQDIIKEIPEQPVEFYLNTETLELTIVYQNGQYKMLAQDATEYPVPVVAEEGQQAVTLNGSVLLSGISRSLPAVANDKYRPNLSSICFDIKDGTLSLVASDGNQMALTTIEIGETPVAHQHLLGTRPATLLRNILAKEQGDVVLKFGERNATFTTSEYSMTCRLSEGRYPNYGSIIPKDNPYKATVNRVALISVLRRVLVVANPATTLIKFRLETSTLHVSSQDVEFGKSAEETLLCDYSGAPIRIAFRGPALLDALQNLVSDEIGMELSDPGRAGLIFPTPQTEGQNVLMLIMPTIFHD